MKQRKKQQKGYIKLHRKLLNWEWWDDGLMVKAWIYCLLNATYKDIEWKGVKVVRGSFVTSLRHMAEDLDCTYRMVRSVLARLKESKNIDYKSFNTHTLIVIVNYEAYQSESEYESEKESENDTENGSLSDTENESENESLKKPLKKSGSDVKNKESESVFGTESESVSDTEKESENGTLSESYNKNIIKNNIKNNSSSNAPARACACEEVDVNDLAEWLRSESGESWKEVAMMQLGIRSLEALNSAFEDYQRECILQGVKWKDAKDIRSHFTNMMRIVQKKEKQNKNGNTRGNIQHTDTRDLVAVAKGMLEYEKGMEGGE